MAIAAVIGLSASKRLLRSSIHYSADLSDMLSYTTERPLPHHQLVPPTKMINAKKSSICSPNFSSRRRNQSINALKELVDSATDPSNLLSCLPGNNSVVEDSSDSDISLEALLLLQKSMLEKQWKLSTECTTNAALRRKICKKIPVTCSGTSARHRRMENRQQLRSSRKSCVRHFRSIVSSDLLQIRMKGYIKGVINEELLSHAEVIQLSIKIKEGLSLEDQRARLKQRLGFEPSDEQLAMSLNISRGDLQSKLIACSLAREKLAMSNVRLVMSIAQRYDNMGAEMSDLIQGGLIGLLRGIEKFDSSKGFKISTYVYWWIRQGVSRALVENSRTLRLPTHLHERLGLIRNAKLRLEEKGIIPSIDKIAECLNLSQKKVRNATEASSKVVSLDREAFPSINGLPGETLHSYIADIRVENDPWNKVEEWVLKEEVNKLINSTLREREREIIRLYYGLDKECLTWEDISKRIGLSRERVRQVGLIAIEKLKHSARRIKMEALLVKH